MNNLTDLEEVAERLLRESTAYQTEGYSEYQNGRFNGIIEGVKFQQGRSYSKEELKEAFNKGHDSARLQNSYKSNGTFEEDWLLWFEQFKKK